MKKTSDLILAMLGGEESVRRGGAVKVSDLRGGVMLSLPIRGGIDVAIVHSGWTVDFSGPGFELVPVEKRHSALTDTEVVDLLKELIALVPMRVAG
jgi:hypothetical protein